MHIENIGDKKYFLCFTEIYVSATQI